MRYSARPLYWWAFGLATITILLPACAKQKAKEPEKLIASANSLSQFVQESPYVYLAYGRSLQIRKDSSQSGHIQTIALLPTDGHSEAWADPRLDVYYFMALDGVTNKETLQTYLSYNYPGRTWKNSDRFNPRVGFFTSYPDPDNPVVEMWDYYFLSQKSEVYRVIVKPGNGPETRNQILSVWESLGLEM